MCGVCVCGVCVCMRFSGDSWTVSALVWLCTQKSSHMHTHKVSLSVRKRIIEKKNGDSLVSECTSFSLLYTFFFYYTLSTFLLSLSFVSTRRPWLYGCAMQMISRRKSPPNPPATETFNRLIRNSAAGRRKHRLFQSSRSLPSFSGDWTLPNGALSYREWKSSC